MLDYNQGHHLVPIDPALHGSLTDPGCSYPSCFTSEATPEVKAEWNSNLRAEQSLCNILHFTKFLTVHQKNLNQKSIINGVLSDRYECYSKGVVA